eukprot:2553787-Amphidinium_carterae.2
MARAASRKTEEQGALPEGQAKAPWVEIDEELKPSTREPDGTQDGKFADALIVLPPHDLRPSGDGERVKKSLGGLQLSMKSMECMTTDLIGLNPEYFDHHPDVHGPASSDKVCSNGSYGKSTERIKVCQQTKISTEGSPHTNRKTKYERKVEISKKAEARHARQDPSIPHDIGEDADFTCEEDMIREEDEQINEEGAPKQPTCVDRVGAAERTRVVDLKKIRGSMSRPHDAPLPPW